MSDAELRALERAWRERPDDETDARWLRALARAGRLPGGALERAALLGHGPALQVQAETGAQTPPEADLGAWLGKVAAWGPEASVRLAAAAVAGVIEERVRWQVYDGPDDLAVLGLDALDAWLARPGPEARLEVEAARAALLEAQAGEGYRYVPAGNVIGRALQTITEPALAPEHALAATVDGWGDDEAGLRRVVRAALVPWVLGREDPAAARRATFGGRFGRVDDIVRVIAFDAAGARALTATHHGTVTAWDVAGRRAARAVSAARRDVHAAVLTPDGARAIVGDIDGRLTLWDLDAGAARWTVAAGADDGVHDAALVGDGRRAVTAHRDGTLRVWDLDGPAPAAPLTALQAPSAVRHVAVAPDGRHAASGGAEPGLVRRWDLAVGAGMGALEVGAEVGLAGLAFTPDGARLVAATERGQVAVWDAARGERLALHPAPAPPDLPFSSDSTMALAVTRDGRALLARGGRFHGYVDAVDLASGAHLRRWRARGLVLALGASPAGLVLAGTRSGGLRVLEAP